jgi:hypothetical protein
VKFPRLRTAQSPADEAMADDAAVVTQDQPTRSYTAPKGRPTPKRREAQRQRGPAAPPPRTQREAMRRAKGNKQQRRSEAAERRERMAAGDDRYLLPRDKGPVKAFVRDVVDSRRHLIGLFMPLAVLVLFAMIAPSPLIQRYAAPATLFILVIMVVEGVVLGRHVIKRVRQKFPDAADRSMSLGWYSFIRASQVRKLRVPKPRTKPGDTVS